MPRVRSLDFEAARARKVSIEAEIAEIELAQIEGRLVPAADVQAAWTDVLGVIRARLLTIGSRAAPLLAAETDAGQCQAICDDLIEEALEALADYRPDDDPTRTDTRSGRGGDDDASTAKAAPRKSVGRPSKTARLAKQRGAG